MSTSAKRTLKILKALKGHTLNGLSNNDLARIVNDTPSNITRALDTLITEGLVEKKETGRFSLSIQTLQIAVSHLEEMDKVKRKADELNQRVISGSRN